MNSSSDSKNLSKTFYSILLKSTKLYSTLKNINKALNLLATKPNTPLDILNKYILKVALLANLTIPNMNQDKYNNSDTNTITKLKEYKYII
ncbi:5164_t:CDS:2 [Scutellospora calospora]|uniref:5164_t:CDS:1 n=1 Tax=Scutellospora calospora TaxID=85575 RepID=A0ACA9JUG0_9GLOM|nr:5164_t:CDS:2 [Scutellospora calospora]